MKRFPLFLLFTLLTLSTVPAQADIIDDTIGNIQQAINDAYNPDRGRDYEDSRDDGWQREVSDDRRRQYDDRRRQFEDRRRQLDDRQRQLDQERRQLEDEERRQEMGHRGQEISQLYSTWNFCTAAERIYRETIERQERYPETDGEKRTEGVRGRWRVFAHAWAKGIMKRGA